MRSRSILPLMAALLTAASCLAESHAMASEQPPVSMEQVRRNASKVLPQDYQTPEERQAAKSLIESPRLDSLARRIADRQVFNASRVLGQSSIHVGPNQLPEIWDQVKRVAELLCVDPARIDLFVSGIPQFSTFSWGYGDRQALIVLAAQVHRDLEPTELSFVLASELSALATDQNLYRNIVHLVSALQDETFRQTYGVPDRWIKDVHNWELGNAGLAKVFHTPRMVIAILGISTISQYVMTEVTTWIFSLINRRLFQGLAKWSVNSKISANRAGLLVTYLMFRQRGLSREQAVDGAVETAARTFSKFILGDPELARKVNVEELVAQGREVVEQMAADKATFANERNTWFKRFTGWFRDKLRSWFWGTAGLDDNVSKFQSRGYLVELVELIDYTKGPDFRRSIDRIEDPSGASIAATAMRGLQATHSPSDPEYSRAHARLASEIRELLSAEEQQAMVELYGIPALSAP